MRALQKKIWILLPIFLIALFISTYKLTESPRVWHDDGLNMQVARNVAHFNRFQLQAAPGEFVSPIATLISTGYPVTYPVGLAFKIFGVGILQARVVMVAFLMLLILASYLLIYKIYGHSKAAIATLLLVSFAPLYGNGKILLGEIPGLLFLVLFLLSVVRLEESGYSRPLDYVWLGLTAGLTVSTKPIFLLLIPAFLLAIWLERKRIRHNKVGYILAVSSFSVMLAVFYFTEMAGESLFRVLSYYGNAYEASLQAMIEAVFMNFLRFFKETTPVYFFLLMLFWFGFWRVRIIEQKQVKLAEKIALFFSVIMLLAYLKTPGWYRYFFPAHLLALLFLPAVLFGVFPFINKFFRYKIPVSLLGYGLAIMITFQFYQVGFSSWVAGDYGSTRSKELRDYFKDFPNNKSVFIYQATEVVAFLPSDNYYQFFRVSGQTLFGDRQILISAVPNEVIVSAKVLEESKKYLSAYKLKTTLYKNLYYVFERKK